ncbi:MAG: RNA methyltransferase, partial [Proteobacteria bacterium]|nr:RNA methyltransferase [Burkholderiales bacterium]
MNDVTPITSRANPTFQRLRRLAQDPRERTHSHRTLLEGAHLVASWCARDLPIQTLVVDAALLASPARA